jgi:flagellar biosynthesis protein FlgN
VSPLLPHVLAEVACMQSFVAALKEEDEALLGRRFQELPGITQRKSALLEGLAEIDRARECVQAQLGLGAGRAGADACIRSDEALGEAWSALLALARHARTLSQTVAAKTYIHLEFVENALAFLQARPQPLYGRDGARTSCAAGSSLALG